MRDYTPGMKLEKDVIYEHGGKKVYWSQSGYQGPCAVYINGRKIMAGQMLNEHQAVNVAQDALDVTWHGGYPMMDGVSFTEMRADGAGELECRVLINGEDTGELRIVLDRAGRYVLYEKRRTGEYMIGWSTSKREVVQELHKYLLKEGSE